MSETPRLVLHLHLAEYPGKSVPSVEKTTNQHASTGWHRKTQDILEFYEASYRQRRTQRTQPTVVVRGELLRCPVRLVLKLHFAIDAREMSVPSLTKFLLTPQLSSACTNTMRLCESYTVKTVYYTKCWQQKCNNVKTRKKTTYTYQQYK